MRGRILIVDDERSMCELLEADLRLRDLEVAWRTDAASAFELFEREEFDVVLSDLNLPGMNGIDLCDRIVANRPDVPVVVITAFGSLETATAAIRAGAYDFVTKPVEMDLLGLTIDRALRHRSLKQEVRRLRESRESPPPFAEILGTSPPMERLLGQIDRVADSDASVLITGESGTGKELVARALHRRSRRHAAPFVAVNCASLPEHLLESELFGHARGAFTDARSARTGLVLQAHGGTLFLDEIGDMPSSLQPKLLRVLEERTLRPVGGDDEVPFDVRVLAATHRDLEACIRERRFREDLYFRINVIQIAVPPLRTRGTDVLSLAQQFTRHFAEQCHKHVLGLSHAVAEKLLGYAWPGNVRELRNAIERAVAMARYEELAVEDLPQRVRAYRRSDPLVEGDDPADLAPLHEIERRYILHVLDVAGGNKTEAARILGLDRKTLYRKLDRFGEGEQADG